jgi:hypothetical protein
MKERSGYASTHGLDAATAPRQAVGEGQLEPVSALLPGRAGQLDPAGRPKQRMQYPSAAGGQGLDPGRHVGTPARELGGITRQVCSGRELTPALTGLSTRAQGHSPSSHTPIGEACRFTSSRPPPIHRSRPSATARRGSTASRDSCGVVRLVRADPARPVAPASGRRADLGRRKLTVTGRATRGPWRASGTAQRGRPPAVAAPA